MRNKKFYIAIIAVFVLTALFAALHLITSDKVEEGYVILSSGNKEISVHVSALERETVTGVRINGKGEEVLVEGVGVALADLLKQKAISNYTSVTVISDDSYSATIHAEELQKVNKAFLLVEGAEARLVVFGDTDSKRSIKNIKHIVIE